MAVNDAGKAFLTWCAEQRDGAMVNEAGEALPKLMEAVEQTAGTGSVVITLKAALKKDTDDEVVITDTVRPTIPENRSESWFLDPVTGRMVRERPRRRRAADDPNQTDLLATGSGVFMPHLDDIGTSGDGPDDGPDPGATWGGRTPYSDE